MTFERLKDYQERRREEERRGGAGGVDGSSGDGDDDGGGLLHPPTSGNVHVSLPRLNHSPVLPNPDVTNSTHSSSDPDSVNVVNFQNAELDQKDDMEENK